MKEEKELAEILVDFATALEAACVNLKKHVYDYAVAQEADKPVWDASKISWEKAQGSRGEYERSSNSQNLDFQNLVKDLQAHGGRLRKGGYFYWLFEVTEKPTVGRKPVKKTVQQP